MIRVNEFLYLENYNTRYIESLYTFLFLTFSSCSKSICIRTKCDVYVTTFYFWHSTNIHFVFNPAVTDK